MTITNQNSASTSAVICCITFEGTAYNGKSSILGNEYCSTAGAGDSKMIGYYQVL